MIICDLLNVVSVLINSYDLNGTYIYLTDRLPEIKFSCQSHQNTLILDSHEYIPDKILVTTN